MSDELISRADLRSIERSLSSINARVGRVDDNLDNVQSSVDNVDSNVQIIQTEVGELASNFNEFYQVWKFEVELQKALTTIGLVRQELEKKFGHHETSRRHITGLLDATDLEIVRSDIILEAAQEKFLDDSKYWLTPCLVALAAWINDMQELANRALREAIRRNDEKTSLLFALICRRADRRDASLKWIQRYLANQDEENLDRKAVIILDAFASGLLGADSEGVVARQINEWIEHLSEKPGFVEQQIEQWSDAINMKRQSTTGFGYTYLRKYSKTWPSLSNIMEGACLHEITLNYFENIFNQESSTETIKAQLDEILKNLVTSFDDEELPLREEEKYLQFVIDFKGDTKRAKANMDVEKTAFETQKDFTQLLTDAVMKPESSGASASTQKFAIALSRDWIKNAYDDIIAKNRMIIPNDIQINVDSFNDTTTDGQNENEIIERFNSLIEREKTLALSMEFLSGFEKFCLWGGAAIGGIGLVSMLFGQIFLGLLAIAGGAGLVINHFSKKKRVAEKHQNIESQFENKRKTGEQIVRATLAEVVDFRAEFEEKDSESQKVTAFLEQISPDQYVKRLSETTRRIKIAK